MEDYIDAIDHLVQLVGIDHVGIGTDFTQDQPFSFWRYIGSQQGTKFPSTFQDGSVDYTEVELYPKGIETPDKMSNVAIALMARGYGKEDILKILGANWVRLSRDVWPS